ncbi:unnamed protein product [Leptosia nina]|uniref:Uncharacterized protein n=1 Tax=Leptosia nina TaxID=320188 RepID=A0AAV1JVE4_9NEOP
MFFRSVIPVLLSIGAAAVAQEYTDSPIAEETTRLTTDAGSEARKPIERSPFSVAGVTFDYVTTTVDESATSAASPQSDRPTRTTERVPATKPSFVKPKPKLASKLHYFGKESAFGGFARNAVERAAKRRFKSRCRCEKIWNCPKLQITVPRCPDEYFLCCF